MIYYFISTFHLYQKKIILYPYIIHQPILKKKIIHHPYDNTPPLIEKKINTPWGINIGFTVLVLFYYLMVSGHIAKVKKLIYSKYFIHFKM